MTAQKDRIAAALREIGPLSSAEGWSTIILTSHEAERLNAVQNIQRYFGD